MASGLAARIREIFGIEAVLLEAHNGIYEVSIDGQTLVKNRGKCKLVPSEDEILSQIGAFVPPLPGKEKLMSMALPIMRG